MVLVLVMDLDCLGEGVVGPVMVNSVSDIIIIIIVVTVQLHSLVYMVRGSNVTASNSYKEHLNLQTAQAPIIHG